MVVQNGASIARPRLERRGEISQLSPHVHKVRRLEETMTYKTLLVHSDAGKTTPGRLALAADLAGRFGAHLIGLHIRQRFEAPMFTEATPAIGALYQSYEEAMKTEEAGSQAA